MSQTCWFILRTPFIVSSSSLVDFPCFRLQSAGFFTWFRIAVCLKREMREMKIRQSLSPISSLFFSLSSSSDLDLNQHHLRRSFNIIAFLVLHFLHLPLLTPSPSGIHWFLFRSVILPPEISTASARRNNTISSEALPHWQTERLPC